MKILHIVPSFYPAHVYGGPTYSTYELCRAVAQRGMDVEVLTTDANGPHATLDVDTNAKTDLQAGLSVRYCRRVAFDSVSPHLIRRLPSLVRSADVVHLTAVYSFPTWPTLLACRLARRPLVWSPRGSFQRWERHSRPIEKACWRAVCRALMPRSCILHVTSELEAGQSAFAMPGVAAIVIPNGVATAKMAQMPPLSAGLKLLYIGRLHPIKGIDALLRACAALKRSAGFPWSLIIAGAGDAAYTDSVHQQLEAEGLQAQVSVIGEVRGDAKTQLFLSSHVVVVPSYTENFGIVVVEALAHGRPVIASRGTPWRDLETNECGLCVENAPGQIADAIDRIRHMPLALMGERGRQWMIRDFAWAGVAERMEAVYRQLLRAPVK